MKEKFEVESVQSIVRVAIAAVLGVWQGLPQVTQVLLWLMILDVVLGVTVAIRDREYNMAVNRHGAFRKVGYIAQLVIAAIFSPYAEQHLGINLVQAASAFYILPELASVTEHTAKLGVTTFPQLQAILDRLPRSSGGQADNQRPTTPHQGQ